MTPPKPDAAKVAAEGLRLCRKGDWKEGVRYLGYAVDSGAEELDNNGLVYSYLGYGLAQTRSRYKEGLALCQRGVSLQFYEPDNYLNLARVYALREHYSPAFVAINEGLKINPTHRELRRLKRRIERRRAPVLGFIDAKHPLNRTLGRIRHRTAEWLDRLDVAGEGIIRSWIGRFLAWRTKKR